MNENFKRQLEIALCEPVPPEKLVECTIQRCQAVHRGRLAEERLAGEKDGISPHDQRKLVADALLGRLSLQMDLPRGLDREWLLKQDAFCRTADGPVANVLTELRQGTLLRRMTGVMGGCAAAPTAAGRSKTGPELEK